MGLVACGFCFFMLRDPLSLAKPGSPGWNTGTPAPYTPPPRTSESLRARLVRLRTVGPLGPDGKVVPFDPDFSLVLFEDFLYSLYAHVHEARGGGRVDSVSAYVTEAARDSLRALGAPASVKAVVVGALHYWDVSDLAASSESITVKVCFESNYTEVSSGGVEQSWYAMEEWTLVRGTQVRSRPPADVRVFKCPNCGAPLEAVRGNTCSYCQQVVDTGAFDWVVRSVQMDREPRGPQLTGTTEEQGTDLPTLKAPDADARLEALAKEDPELSLATLTRRLNHIFLELQVAWSERQWERARPYVSDSLFQSQLYWMKAYRDAGLRNVSEDARTTKLELARVTSDRYFQAITVRVFATGLDYTVRDSDGAVVGGSREHPRAYSEYWTLIRGTGVKSRPRQERACPSCGAPLEGHVNMAGHCTHCQARVASGEFDWVLSRIEQDESYQG
jgi:predicted lipid-binding transport protein (Tim44 family)